jgi:hypothetical protein
MGMDLATVIQLMFIVGLAGWIGFQLGIIVGEKRAKEGK